MKYGYSMRRFCFRAIGLLCAPCLAFAQDIDPAGIKRKVDEGLQARESSGVAFAEQGIDEGRRLAEQSATLLSEARAEYESIHAGDSTDATLLTDYATLLSELGDFDLAEKALLRAVAIDRESPTIWLKLGQTEAALGPRSESRAIRSLRRAAAIEPKSDATVQANASLGALYQQSGLYDLAREAYARALEQDSNHIGSKLALASLDAREGRMVKAKATYDSIGSASIEYSSFIKQTLGVALDEFAESRRWLEDTAEMHLAFAELLVRVDRLADCYWPLNRSLALDDQNYVSWNLMGSVMRAMNQPVGSRDAFARSLELNPDQPRTREALKDIDNHLSQVGADPAHAVQDETLAPAISEPPAAVTNPVAAPSVPPGN